jgi:hypothetical protein
MKGRMMAGKMAFAWLREEDWPTWQTIDTELQPFDQWLAKSEINFAELKSKGLNVERVAVDPKTFSDWCKSVGKVPGRNSRAEFAAMLLMKRLTASA